jgi:glycolate oxidase FAD binding subunit
MSDELFIDGFGPLPVRRPTGVPELCALVREARAAGQGVYPVGGRTTLDLGMVPTKPGIAIDTRGLNAVIEHAARDMTITVQAGMTLAELAKVLAAENQWLPIDVPNPETATVGGAVAANLSGPRRLGHGTFRDYILGISVVTDDGVEVKGGGRVVKNVAGYDLMKLHTGALGTLGVITQLTLKVKPKPEASAMATFSVSGAAVGPTLDRLHASESRPMALEVLSGPFAFPGEDPSGDPWLVACGFEEKGATVDWQVATLERELTGGPARGVRVRRGAEADKVFRTPTDFQLRWVDHVMLKVTTTPSGVAGIVTAAGAFHPTLVHAHAGSGIVWVHLPTELGVERVSSAVAELTKLTTHNGNVTVRRCPPAWKAVLPVWGKDRGDRELMRTVKRTLDPDDVFNPGRLV